MRAMVLTRPGAGELESVERELPIALPGELLIKVRACGVCRTDLHVVDGELPDVEVPLIPGHEIVGVVEQIGDGVTDFQVGDRVGVPWLSYACGQCAVCVSGHENLCPDARFTGYHADGGYADYAVVDAGYSFKLPDSYGDVDAAPLLCAGLIGFRAYRMAGEGRRLGTLRLRRGSAHRRADRRARRARGVRVHQAGRRRGAGIRAERGRDLDRRVGRTAARDARRGDHLRSGRPR